MTARLLTIAIALAVPGAALAQPGSLRGPDHHATPPLPQVLPSPMPSLPPPVSRAPGETPSTPFPRSTQPFAIAAAGFVAYIERDGTVVFDDSSDASSVLIDPVFGPMGRASFDLTRLLLGSSYDPYVAQKLDILDRTRATRARMRANWDQDLMERALSDLPHYLQAVYAQGQWPWDVRRQILFELWDEAAEDGNTLVREGGARARAVISHFIATRLPPDSEHAYTAAEVVELNRERRSRAPFVPYGTGAGATGDTVADAGFAGPSSMPAMVSMRYF